MVVDGLYIEQGFLCHKETSLQVWTLKRECKSGRLRRWWRQRGGDTRKLKCCARGIFCLVRRPFLNPACFEKKGAVWTLPLTTTSDTHAPITHPFLGRFFCLPRCLLTLSRGVDDWKVPCRQSLSWVYFGGLMTIFVSVSGPNTLCDVTCRPSFDTV